MVGRLAHRPTLYDLTHSTDGFWVAGCARDEHENGTRAGCRGLYPEYAARSGDVSLRNICHLEVAMEARATDGG